MTSNPMETRHPDLVKNTNFEEIQASKNLRTKTQKQDWKEEKVENRKHESPNRPL